MADRNTTLADGRSMSFSSAGDSISRRIVFVFLPTGAAGLFDPDPLVTDSWGVRLLEVDRPGYAASALLEPGVEPSVIGHADDVAEYIKAADATVDEATKADLSKVGVVGWGSGSAFALSFAARHPELVDLLVIVGAPSPGKSKLRTRGDGEVDTLKVPRGSTVDTLAEEIGDHPWNRVSSLGIAEDDPAFAAIDGISERLDRTLTEAATQGTFGVAGDLIALDDDSWADDLKSIAADTLILVGAKDPVIGEADAKWFAKRIPGSTVETVPDAGHLVIATAWERILGHVAPKHGLLPPEVRK